jgi:hypothetical protein
MGGENTERIKSRFWKVWKPYERDQVCISEVHPAEVFIIWFMRL